MPKPLHVYDNWSAYDELSDNIPLTEELAMSQFNELLRLKSNGVHMDAYLMDAFWYEPAGAYLEWRKDRWPNGPEAWLEACKANGILPGLWFPANTAFHFEPPKEWQDSLASDGWGFCLFEGGFWNGFLDRLTHWYGRGVRVFKFDFADFGAAPEALKADLLPSQIRSRNIEAYRNGLNQFRKDCPECHLLAYNGFEEAEFMPWTDRPIRRAIDPTWLATFDSIYCGDPRPADVPLSNFWRTLDVYADHMVKHLNFTGLELSQIDNCAFMIGKTGTCYRRGNAGWKTTLLLSLARGGRVHMSLGNLEALTDEDAAWFGKAQELYEGEEPVMLGGIPGKGDWYGYRAENVLTLVNPALEAVSIDPFHGFSEQVFTDGFLQADHRQITLGAGAVAVLTKKDVQLGTGQSPNVSSFIPLKVDWVYAGNKATVELPAPAGTLHVVFQQRDAKGLAVRTSGGTPPDGKSMAELLKIRVKRDGAEVMVERPDDHVIWSGLSWAWAIVRQGRGNLELTLETTDSRVAAIFPSLYVEA